MILKTIYKIPVLRKAIATIIDRWGENKIEQFADFLHIDNNILDIGSGNCLITNNLLKKGYRVTPIDIKDLSIIKNIKPIVYNGTKLPLDTDTFDTALILTVLHHSDNPNTLLKEAKRVAKNIIIIEDTYNSKLQKTATQFIDLIVNLGHSKMTFQNKSELNWEITFGQLELEIVSKRRKSILLFFQQTTYHLKRI